jgi:hypothetical protein
LGSLSDFQEELMSQLLKRLSLIVLVIACLLACKKDKKYPDGEEGLKQLATDLMAADGDDAKKMGENLKLPDPAKFFGDTFGPELGAKLAADYAADAAKLPDIKTFFIMQKVAGRTEMKPLKIEESSDDANVYQIKAIQGMKQKVQLWTLLAHKPGETDGTTLWSFAHVDGTFRYLGKMKAANPSPGPLDDFRKGDVMKALQEKSSE